MKLFEIKENYFKELCKKEFKPVPESDDWLQWVAHSLGIGEGDLLGAHYYDPTEYDNQTQDNARGLAVYLEKTDHDCEEIDDEQGIITYKCQLDGITFYKKENEDAIDFFIDKNELK